VQRRVEQFGLRFVSCFGEVHIHTNQLVQIIPTSWYAVNNFLYTFRDPLSGSI
jgi:hypothetical protein